MSSWLKVNYFHKLILSFENKQIQTLQQMMQQIQRIDLEQMSLKDKEIDRFMNLLDLMKRSSHYNLQQNTTPKKQLVLRFV